MVVLPVMLACTRDTAEAQKRKTTAAKKPVPAGVAAIETAPASDKDLFSSAASIAWAYFDRNDFPESGLVRATENYDYVTIWDIGSAIAAAYSARKLELISASDYDAKISRILQTLRTTGLYDGVAYNRLYSARTGQMVDRQANPTTKGFGWSSTDLGRLLVWLRIISSDDPKFAIPATAVAERMKWNRLIVDGYLQGEDITPLRKERRSYEEGRIGYEQYGAYGFSLWGHRAEKALNMMTNAKPISVLGQNLYNDDRGDDRLTSEPFVLIGLELGWFTPSLHEQAVGILAAQEMRFKRTGIMTMVSEDAMPEPPYYFYYYNVYHDGHEFSIDAQGATAPLNGPRWVSSKAAYAWHALMPSDYTLRAVNAVKPAGLRGLGWGAGVYESTKKPIQVRNINTAAIILEAALYSKLNTPLLTAATRK